MPNGMAKKIGKILPSISSLSFPESLGIHAPFSRAYLRARRQRRPGCHAPQQPGRAGTWRTLPVASQGLNVREERGQTLRTSVTQQTPSADSKSASTGSEFPAGPLPQTTSPSWSAMRVYFISLTHMGVLGRGLMRISDCHHVQSISYHSLTWGYWAGASCGPLIVSHDSLFYITHTRGCWTGASCGSLSAMYSLFHITHSQGGAGQGPHADL